MTDKIFFTKVSPKALQGIRRVSEASGAVVRAKIGTDGTATVVVIPAERRTYAASAAA